MVKTKKTVKKVVKKTTKKVAKKAVKKVVKKPTGKRKSLMKNYSSIAGFKRAIGISGTLISRSDTCRESVTHLMNARDVRSNYRYYIMKMGNFDKCKNILKPFMELAEQEAINKGIKTNVIGHIKGNYIYTDIRVFSRAFGSLLLTVARESQGLSNAVLKEGIKTTDDLGILNRNLSATVFGMDGYVNPYRSDTHNLSTRERFSESLLYFDPFKVIKNKQCLNDLFIIGNRGNGIVSFLRREQLDRGAFLSFVKKRATTRTSTGRLSMGYGLIR